MEEEGVKLKGKRRMEESKRRKASNTNKEQLTDAVENKYAEEK
jgi:hypothetical protein